ncbi:MAG TPA: VCBS repeat-containing protein [Terriglobales bacterium]|nr:VCBS repeat-containing protein [Terriglobales bacterium]
MNHDGNLDIIYGEGHSYGLYWLEQHREGAGRRWIKHTVDESFSQAHALLLADIDGDGEPELITGKRYRGHDGRDPGSYDPMVIYYYKINRQTGDFSRNPISVNGTGGVGTQIIAADMDADGDVDIATAGKSGVHLFENMKINKVPSETREKEILIEKNWPFAEEGPNVEQEDAPQPK